PQRPGAAPRRRRRRGEGGGTPVRAGARRPGRASVARRGGSARRRGAIARAARADLPERPRMRQFSARREAALGFGAYTVYLAVRVLVVNERGARRAARNAARVAALERRLRLDVEPHVQRLLLPRLRL